ncbi:acyltransferase family protein [Hyphococcus luteus]|uniref:Acyltransferase 3 domain-containing protein n=1 Tax=Hyphococcus luteus TaxID=2058213 RepID=A0A2S7K628_9PROT|nr:acyltransferase [Marinicaulis flavus]PQA87931.1 hypothetical protein CW354_06195 [Marinicaulis flavus]
MSAVSSAYSNALGAGSQALEIARVFCILFMSYVHLHFFDAGHASPEAFLVMEAVIADILGRSSVPLLSVASGFLMVRFFARRDYKSAVSQRFRTLIIPMMIWNALAMILFMDFRDAAPLDLVNGLLAVTEPPAQLHLAFLRDLMALTCLTPLFIYGARRRPVVTALIVAAVYLAQPKIWIVLRTQILFFYVVGVYLAVHADRIRFPTRWEKTGVYAVAGAVTLVQIAALFEPRIGELIGGALYDNAVRRPVIALAMWCFCVDIAPTAAGRRIHLAGKNMFLFFLAHGLIFHAVGAAYARTPDVLHGQLIYTLAWLATPVAALIGLNLVLTVRGRIFPPEQA